MTNWSRTRHHRTAALVFTTLTLLAMDGGAPSARAGAADDFGKVSFPTSCAASVAKPFETAVARLHSFDHAAVDAFTAIAKTDRNCAMAWWGAAMSARGNPLGGMLDADALGKGPAFLRRAKAAQPKTERERAFIDALDVYCRDYGHGGHAARTQAYEAAMERLAHAYPDDPEATAFYALAILEAVDLTDKTYARQLKAAKILEDLWTSHPDHPGAPHYLIHAYAYAPLAERGLAAARRYAAIAPASLHARHMPSHIFTMLGLWEESIAANESAAQLAPAMAQAAAAGPAALDIRNLHGFDFIAYAAAAACPGQARRRGARAFAARAQIVQPGRGATHSSAATGARRRRSNARRAGPYSMPPPALPVRSALPAAARSRRRRPS